MHNSKSLYRQTNRQTDRQTDRQDRQTGRQAGRQADIHDNQTRVSFHQLFGGLVTVDPKWLQAVLPIRNGGFGLTSAVTTAPFAFLASWAHTMFTLPQRFPEMKEAITNLLLSNQPAGSIGYNLYNSLPTDEFLPDLVTNHVKLQHRLTENHHKPKVQEFMDHLSTSRDRSRFNHCKDRVQEHGYLQSHPFQRLKNLIWQR